MFGTKFDGWVEKPIKSRGYEEQLSNSRNPESAAWAVSRCPQNLTPCSSALNCRAEHYCVRPIDGTVRPRFGTGKQATFPYFIVFLCVRFYRDNRSAPNKAFETKHTNQISHKHPQSHCHSFIRSIIHSCIRSFIPIIIYLFMRFFLVFTFTIINTVLSYSSFCLFL